MHFIYIYIYDDYKEVLARCSGGDTVARLLWFGCHGWVINYHWLSNFMCKCKVSIHLAYIYTLELHMTLSMYKPIDDDLSSSLIHGPQAKEDKQVYIWPPLQRCINSTWYLSVDVDLSVSLIHGHQAKEDEQVW